MGSECTKCGEKQGPICGPCVYEQQFKEQCELGHRIDALQDAVSVLANNLRSYIMDQAVGDWTQDISDEVNSNPIAAAAVREAGR